MLSYSRKKKDPSTGEIKTASILAKNIKKIVLPIGKTATCWKKTEHEGSAVAELAFV